MAQDFTEFEKSLIGGLLNNPQLLATCKRAGVTCSWFTSDAWSLLYSALLECDTRGELEKAEPLTLKADAEKMAKRDGERRDASGLTLDAIQAAMDCGTFYGAEGAISHLRGYYLERRMLAAFKLAKERAETSPNVAEVIALARGDLEKIERETAAADDTPDQLTFAEIPEPRNEEDDESVIFKNRYFRKGHSLFIVSTSGAGKSVFVNQLSLFMASGREFLGMIPRRPLRVGVIQAEDDVQEMADFRRNLKTGLLDEYGWSEADFESALRGVTFAQRFKGKAGDVFLDALRDWQRKNNFDVIIVNPLFAYFGGDLSSGRDCTAFFRERLDPMMCDPVHGFGLVVVHHTIKPPKGDERKKWGMDDFGQYLGAGGTDIAGWSRASFLLLPIPGHFGWFRFAATKRGGRLGWRDKDGNATNERILRYGEKAIYWRIPAAEEIPEDILKVVALAAKPKEIGMADAVQKICNHLRVQPLTKTNLWNWCLSQFRGINGKSENPAYLAYLDVTHNPEKHGVSKRKNGRATEFYISATVDLPGADFTPRADAIETPKKPPRPVVGDYDADDVDELAARGDMEL